MVHICRGTGVRYRAVAKLPGCRKWVALTPWGKSKLAPFRKLAEVFGRDTRYKRGAVLMIADYYDPISIAEIKR